MDNVATKHTINLLIDRLCGIKLRFDGHSFLLVSELTALVYHFFVTSNNPAVTPGIKITDGGHSVRHSFG